MKRRNVAFAIGYAAFLGAHATFGLASNALGMWAGWALVGLHMGLTHSLIGATLQSYAPDSLSGTAFRCGEAQRAMVISRVMLHHL